MSIDDVELSVLEELSKRDDFFNFVVPSTIRSLISEIRRLRMEKTQHPVLSSEAIIAEIDAKKEPPLHKGATQYIRVDVAKGIVNRHAGVAKSAEQPVEWDAEFETFWQTSSAVPLPDLPSTTKKDWAHLGWNGALATKRESNTIEQGLVNIVQGWQKDLLDAANSALGFLDSRNSDTDFDMDGELASIHANLFLAVYNATVAFNFSNIEDGE